ncbi:MAG: M1 family metallopeptidase [Bacteroidia bacterium]|nr:M1 family metallopeptidase [Bacteroidia bacterium]
MKKYLFITILCCTFSTVQSQTNHYWQQHVDYTMSIDMDVENYQYSGIQKIIYTNNSPDTLQKVFYHLFFNAFQPGSEMDIRVQNILDPDRRMVNNIGTEYKPILESKIAKLKPDEIGFINVKTLKQDGKELKYETIGTILKVTLNKPIGPGEQTVFDMTFLGQVPQMVRRSGRNSQEGVALSMAQWYPKLAEYDFEGWHANSYIGREFYSVWGNYDVKITIDKDYILGGTGYLQNPNEIGFGYETGKVNRVKGKKLTWHFKAPNVHDFTWAADPDYNHDIIMGENDVKLHFLYKNNPNIIENWKKLQPLTAELLSFFNKHVGQYPYKQYSVIQGGDGGMEYGMCTLITGERRFGSLVGTTAHELAHSWFQFLLANNEAKHEWMDEGFTDYIGELAVHEILNKTDKNPFTGAYNSYFTLAKSGLEQPQSTYADRYKYNFAYSAYNKGAVFVSQLGYIIGEENLKKTIKKYFEDFKFKHPTPNDFKRTAEKVSGLQLDWYLNEWTQSTNTIDYAVKTVNDKDIILENLGDMPMPIDITVTYIDGTLENFNIPLRMMYGQKPTDAKVLKDWSWVEPYYKISINKTVKSVEIDPAQLMADINRSNNLFLK